MLKLSDIPRHTSALITEINAGTLSQRLLELGFYPEQEVQVTSKALFGDPIAVRVGQSTVLLRSAEAEGVMVELRA